MERPFSKDEIKIAVFESDGLKAPGKEGFTMAFYQECWDNVKEDLLKKF